VAQTGFFSFLHLQGEVKAERFSETGVSHDITTQSHNPEDLDLNLHRTESLKSRRPLLTSLLTYSLTHSLHGAGYTLKSRQSLSLSNKSLSLWKTKVHYRVHKSPPPDPILSQLNPFRPIDPYSLTSILMLSSHLRLGLGLGLPSGALLS
jgi:hypothetical protein